MTAKTNLYDVIVNWRINQVCSFHCDYCSRSLNSNVELNSYSHEAERFFLDADKTFLICLTGGEPFLLPRFVELCEKLTAKHRIGIYTNLTSEKVFDFSKRIGPEKVEFLDCSLHIEERKRRGKLDDFVDKFSMLRDMGFNVVASLVAHPLVLERFEDLYSYFKEREITIIPQNLQGFFRNKFYPRAYTAQERRKMVFYSEISNLEAQKVQRRFGPENVSARLIDAPYSWKGRPCAAGKDFVYLEHDGTFTRCLSQKDVLGSVKTGKLALYEKPEPCGAEICRCAYHGLNFATGEPRLVSRRDMLSSFWSTKILSSYFEPILDRIPQAPADQRS